MDTLLGQSDSKRTPAAMTARVFADAKRAFSGAVDEEMLKRFAHEAVDELYRESIKVTTFVPVLAMRRVRDWLDSERPSSAGATADA
jgi:hypothetical protein